MKSKVMLIFPPFVKEAFSSFPPLGIAQLAAYILSRNPQIKLKIIDFTVSNFTVERLRQELDAFEPEVLGISVLTLNAPFGILAAKIARQHDPGIMIVIGGVHATMLPEECLEDCDIVVRGEGEETFWEILQEHPLDSIDGISFKRNGHIVHNKDRAFISNLDELPFPAHHLFEVEKYECFPGWGIIGSRGCPYNCIFCSSPVMWKRRLRLRSPKSIVREIEYLHKRFGVSEIMLFDDTINITQKRAVDICDEIVSRRLHKSVSFACQMRANAPLVSSDLFVKMKEANFSRIEFGIESGSQRVLDSIQKSLTVEEARRAVRLAKDAGIPIVKCFFLIGSWNETFIDVLQTWHFILSTPIYPVFSICTPFPGTRLYDMSVKRGYVRGRLDWSVLNQNTAVARTNRMSRIEILFLWAISFLLFEVLLILTRGQSLMKAFEAVVHNLRVRFGLVRLRAEIKKHAV